MLLNNKVAESNPATGSVAKRFLAFMLMTFLALSMLLPLSLMAAQPRKAFADDPNTARNGVVYVQLYFVNDQGSEVALWGGSGALLDDNHVLTCWHVATLPDDIAQSASSYLGYNVREKNLQLRVSVMGDVYVKANYNEIYASRTMDWAVLTLDQSIQDRTHLKVAKSADMKTTDQVWALGFPSIVNYLTLATPQQFRPEDVTVESGTISKHFVAQENGVSYLQHSAKISEGNSGGPLVNAAGEIVGINSRYASYSISSANYFNAIAVDQIVQAVNALGGVTIDSGEGKLDSGGMPPVEEANKTSLQAAIASAANFNAGDYTEASASKFTNALSAAKSVESNVSATQEQVDKATSNLTDAISGLEKSSPMTMIIIAVAVIAVIIIVIIVIVVVLSSSKKKKKKVAPPSGSFGAGPSVTPTGATGTGAATPPAAAAQTAYQPQSTLSPAAPQQTTYQQQPAYQPGTTPVFDQAGAGDTTVLNPAVGETTMLGGAQSTATLVRKSNNERIRINKQEFLIGKERNKVNFVIPDNSAISRQHARITVRNGQYFITDLNTTNFTFVNDKKVAANVETPLNSGDVVRLADEEFVFEA